MNFRDPNQLICGRECTDETRDVGQTAVSCLSVTGSPRSNTPFRSSQPEGLDKGKDILQEPTKLAVPYAGFWFAEAASYCRKFLTLLALGTLIL